MSTARPPVLIVKVYHAHVKCFSRSRIEILVCDLTLTTSGSSSLIDCLSSSSGGQRVEAEETGRETPDRGSRNIVTENRAKSQRLT